MFLQNYPAGHLIWGIWLNFSFNYPVLCRAIEDSHKGPLLLMWAICFLSKMPTFSKPPQPPGHPRMILQAALPPREQQNTIVVDSYSRPYCILTDQVQLTWTEVYDYIFFLPFLVLAHHATVPLPLWFSHAISKKKKPSAIDPAHWPLCEDVNLLKPKEHHTVY